METIVIYVGIRTPGYKKTFCENFFNRLGYLVEFDFKKYLINSVEIDKDKNSHLPHKYISLFDYCIDRERLSFSRLQKIRTNQIK